MPSVLSVNMSTEKGTVKLPTPSAELKAEHGLVGDAHAGAWHRQVSLLALESVETMRARCNVPLPFGVFGENIDTEGIELKSLPVGTRLQIGECLLEITQIGKECHGDCAIKKQVGTCVMTREGIFARVLEGGVIQAGDAIARVNGNAPV
ncbi:MAG: MOSC domain-containing protein [Clostridia bacterium]